MRNSSRTQQFARLSRILMTLAIVVTLTMLVRAMRQDEGPGRGRGPGGGLSGFSLFTALETDGQEGLSPAEIDHAPAVLRSLDKNGDGRLTSDELPAVGRGGRGGPGGFPGGGERGRGGRGEGPSEAPQVSADDLVAMLMAFDANKDGKLTKGETPERLQSLFDRADSNKDGVLTADEIKTSAQAQERQAQQAMRGRGNGEGRGDGEGRFGRGGPGGPDPLISALDVNKDGALSFQEIDTIGAVLRRFDRNGDGIVTLEEVFAGGRGRG